MEQNNMPNWTVSFKDHEGKYKRRGAGWTSKQKNGDTYLSLTLDDGAKLYVFKYKPKPKDETRDGYGQARTGQRDNQGARRIADVVDYPPRTSIDDDEIVF